MPERKEPVCFGCGCDCDEVKGLVKREGRWWCADCWADYNDPSIDVEQAEEDRRQRIIDQLERME
ncbi:hypothetical protein GZ77_26470 [Endozoicomonas montiporae]|uniref:Uncharacterized protein n=1 Tax=Endozoicomonas montiporae TaxID=1027273 RepID=A0A081MYH2_9GAMM|nr:hypothetical protein [Endozoicomonas montiporae]KEQ11245.1 hypothetical protein GZ77_26470 [Endozoicomonas montiporae]